MTKKPFKNVSFYLNSKFKLKNKLDKKDNNSKNIKKIIRLYIVGAKNNCYGHINEILEKLKDNYIFEFTFYKEVII